MIRFIVNDRRKPEEGHYLATFLRPKDVVDYIEEKTDGSNDITIGIWNHEGEFLDEEYSIEEFKEARRSVFGAYNIGTSESWADYLNESVGLTNDEYWDLVHEINNLRGGEWVGVYKMNIYVDDAFKKFVDGFKTEEEQNEWDEYKENIKNGIYD